VDLDIFSVAMVFCVSFSGTCMVKAVSQNFSSKDMMLSFLKTINIICYLGLPNRPIKFISGIP
jgi:hypothetical protein